MNNLAPNQLPNDPINVSITSILAPRATVHFTKSRLKHEQKVLL